MGVNGGLLVAVDPLNFNKISFSDCVSAFSAELQAAALQAAASAEEGEDIGLS